MSQPIAKPQQVFVHVNGQQLGPYAPQQIVQAVQNGQLNPAAAQVWAEGMAGWLPLAQCPQLLPQGGAAAVAVAPVAAGYAPVAHSAHPHAATGAVSYASFGERLLAYIIDNVVLMGIGFVVGMVYGVVMTVVLGGKGQQLVEGTSSLVGIIVSWLYYAKMESSPKRATLGKKALGLEVVNLNGGQVTFAQASGRFAAKILSGLILLIGFIMAGFTERRQGLHDMMAGTLVIKRR